MQAHVKNNIQLSLDCSEETCACTKATKNDIVKAKYCFPNMDLNINVLRNNICLTLFRYYEKSKIMQLDSRRFARPAPNAVGDERNRNFYPYPLIEKQNNTRTPADPTI